MPGGLLNIVSYGNQNVILNGNPSKTFFTSTYAKYTNFGLQKFRIDFNGQRKLYLNEESKFTFKIPRYADLLMDSYIVVTLPTIWSPIYPPQDCSGEWRPYEFKWIKDIGAQMIKEVTITVGRQILQKFSGQYLHNLVERDFSQVKKDLFNKMTGNVDELNDPGNSGARVNQYPNAYYTSAQQGPEPSIHGRKLYIPLNTWFTNTSKMAFPLASLQYNELHIEVVMRPIREIFVIRDVTDSRLPYVRPNFNVAEHQFYRFLQPPPDISLNYSDLRTNWDADIHMLSTYCFLSEDEVKVFALKEQKYLIKEVHEYSFKNITGSNRVELDSRGMVANWMWYFQRSDIDLRNGWSNYTNWPYDYLPHEIQRANTSGSYVLSPCYPGGIGPGLNPWDPETSTVGTQSNLYITGNYQVSNQKNIMMDCGILLDGKYRENTLHADVYDYIEKYSRTNGNGKEGLYCYNFCLNTNPFDIQPNGAMNMSKFNKIELEINTFVPPLDPSAQTFTICDPDTGEIIGVNKPTWRIYDYNYDLTVFEERYNVVVFTSGNAGLMYAR